MPASPDTAFLGILAVILIVAVRGILTWSRNNQQLRIPADAMVVAKRADVSHHHHGGDHGMHTSRSTSYYVTFEFPTGDRLELGVPARAYGQMVEGDVGVLVSQGTRFIQFDRHTAGHSAPEG